MSDMPPEQQPAERPTFITIGLDARWLRRSLVVIIIALILWQIL